MEYDVKGPNGALVHIAPEESVREGWHRAQCEWCNVYTTGSDGVCDEWAHDHVCLPMDLDSVNIGGQDYDPAWQISLIYARDKVREMGTRVRLVFNRSTGKWVAYPYAPHTVRARQADGCTSCGLRGWPGIHCLSPYHERQKAKARAMGYTGGPHA